VTASESRDRAAPVGTVGELVEAAAKALWYDGSPRSYDFALLRRDTQDAYRADARRALAAVLPLLADEIDAERAKLPALLYANDPGHSHDNGLRRAARLLRDLAAEVAR
jgi:hypothetical protein